MKPYKVFVIGCRHIDCEHMADIYYRDAPASPTIDEVYSAFRAVMTADRAIGKTPFCAWMTRKRTEINR